MLRDAYSLTHSQAFSIACSHLEGYWDGVLLCVMLTVKDAEDKTVIVAFAVGPVENADDVYRYMFSNVKRNKDMAAWIDKETTTCYFKDGLEDSAAAVSGIIAAEVPRAEPRRCLRDLISRNAPKIGKVLCVPERTSNPFGAGFQILCWI